MEDREFFDHLYQLWSKTTGASDCYWMPEQDPEEYVEGTFSPSFNIYAVGESQGRKRIASFLSDEDSDFITAVHGCLPDLVRRLNMALDEADNADYDRDARECRIAELELENKELRHASV
jgi:hypothetical protein